MTRASLFALALALAGCGDANRVRLGDAGVHRGHGHGFPWSGYQQPYRMRSTP